MKAGKVLNIISAFFVKIAIILLMISASIGCSSSCSDYSKPYSVRFTDMGDGTVRDDDSGLIWLKDADALGMEDWDNTMKAATTLDEGDFEWLTDGSSEGDWRIPTNAEWESFVDASYYNPALCNASGKSHWSPSDAFSDVQSDAYWSSNMLDAYTIWFMSLCDGRVYADVRSRSHYVWPVRSAN